MELIVSPHREMVLAERRGTFTVPDDLATVNCNCAYRLPCQGLSLNSLGQEHARLVTVARERAKTMRDRLALRGQALVGDLMLHGPWVTYGFEQHLADPDSSVWNQARAQQRPDGFYDDPSKVLGLVFERDAANPFSDYLLVGHFQMREVGFDQPVRVEVK